MRICEKCGENPANIHIRQILNDQESEFYICSKCAEKIQKQIVSFLKVNNYMMGMMQEVKLENKNKTCPMCKFDIYKIRKLGKVGCAKCYEVFEEELAPIMSKMNINRIVTDENIIMQKKIDDLTNQLNQAVVAEKYERAAELRDEIAEIKGEVHDNMAKSRS